jgi:type I restriction enzyme S subunit
MTRRVLAMDKLSDGWSSSQLIDLVDIKGLCIDGDWVESKDQDPKGEIRLIQLADIGDGYFVNKSSRFLNAEAGERLGISELKADDVLVARMPNPLGRACMFPKVDYRACTVVDVLVFRSGTDDILHKWLMHFINSPQIRAKIECQSSGSTRQRISGGNLKKMELPIPPVNEKKRLANKVDALFAQSDKAENALDAISTLLDEYRQSILTAAFRGNLTKDWRKKQPKVSKDNFSLLSDNSYYDDMFNNIPETWDIKVIDNIITDIQSGKSFKCIERPPKSNEKGIIKVSAVSWGSFNEDQSKTVTDNSRLNKRAKIYEGDLLFSRANTVELVGACLITGKFKKDLYLSDKILRLDVPEEYKIYLKWFLRSPSGRKQIEEMATGAQLSMKNISQSSLKNITMPFPPKEEILIICQALEKMEKFLDQISYRIKTSHLKLNTLNQSILAKAFRGGLVPQDPNDEPASVLLKRIQIGREKLKKELKGKKKVAIKKSKGKSKKMIIPVVDALKQSEKPLSAQQLLSAAGYPNNADTDQIEQFFLDIRKAINGMQVETWRENDQDYFKVAG